MTICRDEHLFQIFGYKRREVSLDERGFLSHCPLTSSCWTEILAGRVSECAMGTNAER